MKSRVTDWSADDPVWKRDEREGAAMPLAAL